MKKNSTIGLDIAKSVFHVVARDEAGNTVFKRKLRRQDVVAFFAKQPACLVGMEACGTAHHWAREIAKCGHEVRLLPAQHVKAYVQRGKHDFADAGACAEAVVRPAVKPVPVKSEAQQSLLVLHRCRQTFIVQRTQMINAVRGHLAEFGIVAAKGNEGAARLISLVRREGAPGLPEIVRATLARLTGALDLVTAEIAALERQIAAAHKADETSRRLDTVPGIAALTATAFVASIPDARVFKSGRAFAAWLGLTPKITGTGGNVTLGPITREGDHYLRRLLYTGATSVVRLAKRNPDKHPWLAALLGRLKFRQVAIALANKMARIVWALLVRGGIYVPGHRPLRLGPALEGPALERPAVTA